MQFSKTQLILIGGVLLIALVVILLFTGVIPGLRSTQNISTLKGNLTVWGVFDTEQAVNSTLIADFIAKNPQVKITYRKIDDRTYEQDLINALAAGSGPDVFMFKNSWLLKHNDKVVPLPTKDFPIETLRAAFPSIVEQDFTTGGQTYALPLYIDTLSLFYNQKMFDAAGIAQPPTTWEQFLNMIPQLRKTDNLGRITQAAAAIGGSSNNINEATDLLNAIMLQLGVQMVSPQITRATFATATNGAASVQFYTDFANPRLPQYTWDSAQHYSLDAFTEEKVAMIFNYAYQIPSIKAKNPFLTFSVIPIPQFSQAKKSISYANYWGLAVSSKTADPNLAWQFILNSTLEPTANGKYLNAVSRPPALRELITPNLNDPQIGVFVRQALTAQSWPKIDDASIDYIFTKMIDLINATQMPIEQALKLAEENITTLMQRKAAQ